jgi:hypothetical protein
MHYVAELGVEITVAAFAGSNAAAVVAGVSD